MDIFVRLENFKQLKERILKRIDGILDKMVSQESQLYGNLDKKKFLDYLEKIMDKRRTEVRKLDLVSDIELEKRIKEIIYSLELKHIENFRL